MLTLLSSVRRPVAAKLLIGGAGLALLTIGAGKFAATAGDNGTVAVVIAGGVLLITPLILDRVQRVSVSATRVDLWLVSQVSNKGAPGTAEILQRTMLGSFTESYSLVHDELRDPQYRPARIHLQDLLVEQAGKIARRERFQPGEVQALFANGSLVIRVLALGLMQGDQSLADDATITAAITDGRSRNEQYQGLQLAKVCWPGLSPQERQEVRGAIKQADFPQGTDRSRLAQEVLSQPHS
jgi:hypothetical protein